MCGGGGLDYMLAGVLIAFLRGECEGMLLNGPVLLGEIVVAGFRCAESGAGHASESYLTGSVASLLTMKLCLVWLLPIGKLISQNIFD